MISVTVEGQCITGGSESITFVALSLSGLSLRSEASANLHMIMISR